MRLHTFRRRSFNNIILSLAWVSISSTRDFYGFLIDSRCELEKYDGKQQKRHRWPVLFSGPMNPDQITGIGEQSQLSRVVDCLFAVFNCKANRISFCTVRSSLRPFTVNQTKQTICTQQTANGRSRRKDVIFKRQRRKKRRLQNITFFSVFLCAFHSLHILCFSIFSVWLFFFRNG